MTDYYKERVRMDEDKLQTRLTATGIELNKNPNAKIFIEDVIKDKLILCPFCLNTSPLCKFTKEKGFYICPTCKNNLKENTILFMNECFNGKQPKIAEFSFWIFKYRLSGFFSKINQQLPKNERFKQWNNSLYELGISYDFWDYYKKYKGEFDREEKEDEDDY